MRRAQDFRRQIRQFHGRDVDLIEVTPRSRSNDPMPGASVWERLGVSILILLFMVPVGLFALGVLIAVAFSVWAVVRAG